MKKRIIVLFCICLLFTLSSIPAMSQENELLNFRVYAGYSMTPFKTEGLENINASDWQDYGLWTPTSSTSEGRILLPLEDGNASQR